jgi:hypothetical protein
MGSPAWTRGLRRTLISRLTSLRLVSEPRKIKLFHLAIAASDCLRLALTKISMPCVASVAFENWRHRLTERR